MALPTCKVTGILQTPAGTPIVNAAVVATLSEPVQYQGHIVPHRLYTRSNPDGTFELDLWPNVLQATPQTWYRITIATAQELLENFFIVVPNSSSANIFSLKTKDHVPPETHDDIAKMLAELAEIEANVKNAAAEVKTEAGAVDVNAKKVEQETLESERVLAAAKQSAEQAKTGAEEARTAASDASDRESETEQLHKETEAIKHDIDNIYAQILASLKPGGEQGHLKVVVRETFTYRVKAGETAFSGEDQFHNVLAYTPGYCMVFLNGIFIQNAEDYTATDGSSLTLKVPGKDKDWLNIIALSQQQNGHHGGGGGDINLPINISDVTNLSNQLNSKYGPNNNPEIADVNGLSAALGKAYSADNQPQIEGVDGLKAALATKYGVDVDIPAAAIPTLPIDRIDGLQAELNSKLGTDANIPGNKIPQLDIDKIDGLQASLDGKRATADKIPATDITTDADTAAQQTQEQYNVSMFTSLGKLPKLGRLRKHTLAKVSFYNNLDFYYNTPIPNIPVRVAERGLFQITLVAGGGYGIETCGGGGGEVVSFMIWLDESHSISMQCGVGREAGSRYANSLTTFTVDTDLVITASCGNNGDARDVAAGIGGGRDIIHQDDQVDVADIPIFDDKDGLVLGIESHSGGNGCKLRDKKKVNRYGSPGGGGSGGENGHVGIGGSGFGGGGAGETVIGRSSDVPPARGASLLLPYFHDLDPLENHGVLGGGGAFGIQEDGVTEEPSKGGNGAIILRPVQYWGDFKGDGI